MPSRLSIINDELLLTGNNPFNEPEDGSPGWNVVSAAYDAAVEMCLDKHDWKFSTVIEEVDDREGDSTDGDYADAYAKPSGCLHVIWVRDQDNTHLDWKIVGNQILVNQDEGITVKFVEEPEPDQWPGLFTAALRRYVRAGIYRGLNKDPLTARSEEKAGDDLIKEARPRGDSEEPGRAKFVSGLASARSARRG